MGQRSVLKPIGTNKHHDLYLSPYKTPELSLHHDDIPIICCNNLLQQNFLEDIQRSEGVTEISNEAIWGTILLHRCWMTR